MCGYIWNIIEVGHGPCTPHLTCPGTTRYPTASFDYQNAWQGSEYSIDLDPVITPSEADNTAVTWSSSDSAVASVDADGVRACPAPGRPGNGTYILKHKKLRLINKKLFNL